MICDKVQAWVESLPKNERDLPLVSCCNKLWTPNEILAACLTNSPSIDKLVSILEAHGFGGSSPVNVNAIAQERLKKLLKNVHVLIANNYELSPQELEQLIQSNKGLGRRLVEAEILRMIDQVSKYG